MMKRAGKPAGHDFGDNRVPGDGQKARECLTERPELDNEDTKAQRIFGCALCALKTFFVFFVSSWCFFFLVLCASVPLW